MIQFLLAAPRSGSGKTTMTCALLMALKRRGCAPCAFKSGPDYIDPMFHRAVLGVESRNLDLFFSAPETVRTLREGAAGHGAAVCEGAMGFYDGLGGVSDRASAWHLADTLGLPAAGGGAKGSEPDAGRRAEGARKLPHSQPHRRHPAEQLHGPDARSAGPDAGRRDGSAGAGLSAETPGGRHRFPPSGPLHGGGSGKFASRSWLFWPTRRRSTSTGPACWPSAKRSRPPCRCSRRRLRPASVSPWRRTRRSALPTPRRWKPSGTPGQRWSFSAPLRDTALPENIGGLYLPGGYPNFTQKS